MLVRASERLGAGMSAQRPSHCPGDMGAWSLGGACGPPQVPQGPDTQNMALLRLCWEIQPLGFTSICSIFITHLSRRAPSMNSFRDSWPEQGGREGLVEEWRRGVGARGEAFPPRVRLQLLCKGTCKHGA